MSGRIERLTQIGVLDRRGGEEAGDGSSGAEAEDAAAAKVVSVSREKKEAGRIKIRRVEADDATEDSESSLERLVFRVFFYLAALGLGFALCWYAYPRMVLVPVLVDPRNGQLIDPQTGQIVGELRDANNTGRPDSTKSDPSKSGQPSASTPDAKKGDEAHAK